MKALLRSILLCLMVGTPALAEPTPSATINQNQQSIIGTWSTNIFNQSIVIIFDNTGVIKIVSEKTYGDYKYYELAEYNKLMDQISNESFKLDPDLKYKQQGNSLEVTHPDGRIEKNTLDFVNSGRTLNLSRENNSESVAVFTKVSDSNEISKNTESLTTLEGHFQGLRKLVALQTAQSDYWVQKKRFVSQLTNLNSKIKPMPNSDRSYRYELLKQGQRQSIIAAIPTQPNLRSFVLQLDRVGRRQQPFNGIICGTDRPSDQIPPLPQFKKKELVCAPKTHQVDLNYSIESSLLKSSQPRAIH